MQHYIDDAGQPRSRTTYAIHQRRLWKDFESKWLVPENGYVFVKVRVGKQGLILFVIYERLILIQLLLAAILELISRANSLVKFQRHHLIDLPVELLELIVKNASLEDARIISSTCKRLRTISQRHIFIVRSIAS